MLRTRSVIPFDENSLRPTLIHHNPIGKALEWPRNQLKAPSTAGKALQLAQ